MPGPPFPRFLLSSSPAACASSNRATAALSERGKAAPGESAAADPVRARDSPLGLCFCSELGAEKQLSPARRPHALLPFCCDGPGEVSCADVSGVRNVRGSVRGTSSREKVALFVVVLRAALSDHGMRLCPRLQRGLRVLLAAAAVEWLGESNSFRCGITLIAERTV